MAKILKMDLPKLYARYRAGESMTSLAQELNVAHRSLGEAFDRAGFARLPERRVTKGKPNPHDGKRRTEVCPYCKRPWGPS